MAEFPFLPSRNLDPFTRVEIGQLLSRLKRLGIDEVRSGIELEITIPKITSPDESYFNQRKAELVQQAEGAEQKAEIAKFNRAELFYYDVITSPLITEWLVPLTSDKDPVIRAKAFYDSKETMEFRLSDRAIPELLTHYEVLTELLAKKLEQHHLAFARRVRGGSHNFPAGFHHQSFSFWKDGKNTTLSEHPEYYNYTTPIVAGMAHSLYHGFGLTVADRANLETPPNYVRPATTRGEYMRVANGRIEIRANMGVFPDYNPFIGSMLALTGAAYALDPAVDIQKQLEETVIPANRTLKGIYLNPSPDLDEIRLALTENVFNRNTGEFEVSENTKKGKLLLAALDLPLPETDKIRQALRRDNQSFFEGELEGKWLNISDFLRDSLRRAPLLHEVSEENRKEVTFAHVKSVSMGQTYSAVKDNATNAALFSNAPVFAKVLSPPYLRKLKQFIYMMVPQIDDAKAKEVTTENNTVASRLQARKKEESKTQR